MIILGIDPGGTTGTCMWNSLDSSFYFEQHTTENGADFLKFEGWILDRKMKANNRGEWDFIVVLERFNFRKNEDRDNIVYTPVEVIGVVKLFCARYAVPLELQMAAEGKGFWTNDKIKKIGLWKPASPHAMDALRHVLHFRTFTLEDQSLLMKLK